MSNTFKIQIQVRFRDLDAMGHVNNAVFFTYFEQGRTAFFHDLSGGQELLSFPFILAHISCDYLMPIRLDAKLVLEMWANSIGKKSFGFGYKLADLQNGSIYAKAESVQVGFDYVQGESMEIPPGLRKHLEKYLMAENPA
jgi:acyl-CoA thioester hydrolase